MSDKVDKSKTFVKSMHIDNFRGLKDMDIKIGKNLTLITGFNGTGKSTILGLLAQIFSFQHDYANNTKLGKSKDTNDLTKYKTISGAVFESEFQDHFKISSQYDNPKKIAYTTNYVINDAGENKIKSVTLKSTSRGNNKLRLVLRNNSDRNVTQPTIYLDTKRLLPMVDRKDNKQFLLRDDKERELFKKYTNFVFPRHERYSFLTSNVDNNVSSTIASDGEYDISSASAGEDNLGQILGSLISFIRLKNDWAGYKGGLLLIDEIDATLFAGTTDNLLNLLNKFSKKYNVQIVFTAQSETVIKKMLKMQEFMLKNERTKDNIQINFFNNIYGSVKNESNISLNDVSNLLNFKPLNHSQNKHKVRCVTEDKEAYLFLKTLLEKDERAKNSLIEFTPYAKIGAPELINLAKNKYLSKDSIYILDGDKQDELNSLKNRRILMNYKFLTLPSNLPPDQLMYFLLKSEKEDSAYWKKNDLYPYAFENLDETKNISNNLYYDETTNKYKLNDDSKNDKRVREYFKEWFNNNYNYLKKSNNNPIKQIWIPNNLNAFNTFKYDFDSTFDLLYSRKGN